MSGLCFFKFVSAPAIGGFNDIRVDIPSGSGNLKAAIYSMQAVNFGKRIEISSTQTATLGVNIIPMSGASIPAGNYALAVEGSGTLRIAGMLKGIDRMKRMPFGTFDANTTMDPLGWNLEFYSRFCQP